MIKILVSKNNGSWQCSGCSEFSKKVLYIESEDDFERKEICFLCVKCISLWGKKLNQLRGN